MGLNKATAEQVLATTKVELPRTLARLKALSTPLKTLPREPVDSEKPDSV